MKAVKIPADLAERYRRLIYQLDQIRQTEPATGDPKIARSGSAINVVIDFLNSPELKGEHEDLLAPLYDILGELVERRTAEAEAARKGVLGGRPRVEVWTSIIRAVALAAVDLLSRHGYSRLEARKIVASQLRAAGNKPIPSHATIKQWAHDWAPKQAQPSEINEGHLPVETIRCAALGRMQDQISNGGDPTSITRSMLEGWVSAK